MKRSYFLNHVSKLYFALVSILKKNAVRIFKVLLYIQDVAASCKIIALPSNNLQITVSLSNITYTWHECITCIVLQ